MRWRKLDYPRLQATSRPTSASPVAGRRVALEVCSFSDLIVPGTTDGLDHNVVLRLNCCRLFTDHVMDTVHLGRHHDGRNLLVYNYIMSDSSVWERLGKEMGPFFLALDATRIPTIRLLCKHGRHRSLGTATALATLLDAMGLICSLYVWDGPDRGRPSRLCTRCRCGDGDSSCANACNALVFRDAVSLRLSEFTDGMIQFLKHDSIALSEESRQRLEDICDWEDLYFDA